MAAIVCRKRSYFEELDSAGTSLTFKKFRYESAISPVWSNYVQPVQPGHIDQLKTLFPDSEIQFLQKALEDSGYNIDSAIQIVHEHAKHISDSTVQENASTTKGSDAVPLEVPIVQNNLPTDGIEWVESLVSEMMKATSIPDARSRAVVILESLEKTISARAASEATQTSHKEIVMLKEQMEILVRDNNILKRAVAIQHDRQKDFDLKRQEFEQLVAQYQEQMRTLELNNYALRMHLQQAERSSPIPGHFHPDVF